MKRTMLENIRIVLVNTSHPGNIGAVARAMKTMGLEHLVLVNPDYFPHPDATARASGADDVLHRARCVASLEEAVADCALVFGASARLRTISWPQLDARQCGERIAQEPPAVNSALVFGRERIGLTNQELEHCHYLVHIPANPEYASLNIGSAVQVLGYECRMAQLSAPAVAAVDEDYATGDDMDRFYLHLLEVLQQVGFYDPANPRQLSRRLKRMFNRLRPDKMELNILRGILTSVQKKFETSE